MNFKKIGIAGVLGFFSMAFVGTLTFELFYKITWALCQSN